MSWLKSWVEQRFEWLDGALEYTVSGVNDVRAEMLISVKPYPNPFDRQLNFEYTLSRPAAVAIDVYDALGRSVASVRAEHMEAGTYSATCEQSTLSQGLYFYRVKVDGQVAASGQLSKGTPK